jgi:signal transduction histidine kinase
MKARAVALPALAAAAVLVLGWPAVRLAAAYPDAAPGGGAPWETSVQAAAAAAVLAAGTALAARRATALSGTLLILAAPAILIAALPAAQARPALLFTVALAGGALAPALLGSAALTCPVDAGRTRRWALLAVASSIAVAGLVSGLLPATLFDAKASGCFSCPANLAEVHAAPDLRVTLIRWGLAFTIGTGGGTAFLATWRWLRTPRIVRLVNAPVVIGGAAAALLAAVAAWHALRLPVPEIDAASRAIWLAQCCAAILMAGGVAATALRARRQASRIAGQVLAVTPDAATLQRSLAESIHDPSLVLVFARDDGTLVDANGHAVGADGADLAVAAVTQGGKRIAEVRYRAALAGAEQLLETAVRSAGLALEHIAAQARLRAELADVATSRRRIIEDGDAERRRLERDLHDGAQQRLIGVQLFLQLAADDAPDGQAETYLRARQAVGAALADLRDLAHGIHPAALTDDGLMTGLRTLANRSPVPVIIRGPGPATRSVTAEAAAYRLVGYAVHAAAGLDGSPVIQVTADGDAGTLRIRIEAETVGEQAVAGIMARAADRIAAADGAATVAATATRTTITAAFPCAS